VRFLIDAQLPPALARWLCEAGHDARHVEDVNLREAEDSPIWRYALEHQTVIVTKDEDFAERARHHRNAPVIVWLRVGNVSNRELRQCFLPHLPQVLAWIDEGLRVVEIR
jgi:predicted nuclease of predicted toxin-antitoxin system